MKRMFKSIKIAISFFLVLVLSSCGTSSKIHIIDDVDNKPEFLSFFSPNTLLSSDLAKYWSDQFIERYNKRVYINLDGSEYYAESGMSYRELLVKRLESSAPDDMYIINAEDVLEFGKKGFWRDLSDLSIVDNLSEAALYHSTYNNRVYSLPLGFTGFGFAWNIDLLDRLNLSIPNDLNEFEIVCEGLKNAGILPYGSSKGYSLTVPAMGKGLSRLYNSNSRDSEMDALNSGKKKISEYLEEGYEFLNWMIEKDYMDPVQALNTVPKIEDVDLFKAEQCGFICIDLGSLTLVDLPFEWELTGLPILEEGMVAVNGASQRLCVNPNSNHLDTVLQFVEMIGTTDSLDRSAKLDNVMSSAKDSKVTINTSEQKLVSLLDQNNQVPNQDFSLHFNTWESIRDVAREICGGMSIKDACELLDEKQMTDIENYVGDFRSIVI